MKNGYCYFTLLVLFILASCSPKGPYAVTNKVYKEKTKGYLATIQMQNPDTLRDSSGMPVPSAWVGTVNFGIRKPNYVIIHFTAQDSLAQTLHTFTITSTQVSSHYVIGKDGKVVHMVNDYLRANHAGLGKWGSVTDMNSCSIGIEIDNNGSEPFTAPQINSLLLLLAQLKKSYNIPQANFIGHQDFAPKRKPDPGPYFPWKTLAAHGFGYWSDDVLELAPDGFDYSIALKLIGYDTSDPKAAVVAFKRHFVQTDIKPEVTQLDLNVLYNVYQKYSPPAP
ncbi:N-acetylmuramoyl-L-alanine amidase [Mucilaginibacter gotjawali]|uniref:N-acetylmuramoyl-L-alanine amidase n=2 Tax=Mucilaginibacter gotjawali TaxID=1550579 RepID=A0A110B0B4_9SPHI|nr:N-acetylmuramoyl-L-alanine amidase [Mucilaginibacter gotjawali]MBB3057881.1 N-acetylmuramoyl-L-alanine amidase [Mucilaginibacter gotjawali]BAU52347.1 N-acetylmuramoyl-L-alanine amidase AmiD precursor [Mucilaginibacter gotjawali]